MKKVNNQEETSAASSKANTGGTLAMVTSCVCRLCRRDGRGLGVHKTLNSPMNRFSFQNEITSLSLEKEDFGCATDPIAA
ncbi:hypothetical protein BM221_007442 [Beauveria bassiana]|uniref:Uncharacterized protein n=1 Tax=Beauveria bassiana TaxID=176275 RepID=A0A2N6NGN7_BEABA|nr:hypothetical protein BM221_007442 [Beauveria bassiana]